MLEAFYKIVCCGRDSIQDDRPRVTFAEADAKTDAQGNLSRSVVGKSDDVGGAASYYMLSRTQSEVSASRSGEESMLVAVSQLEELGGQLGTLCLKYPKGGRSAGAAKSRYIAVMPCDFSKSPEDDAVDAAVQAHSEKPEWGRKLKFWRQGRIAFWRDQDAYRAGAPPKAMASLNTLLSVDWEPERPCDVTVRYTVTGRTHKLTRAEANQDQVEEEPSTCSEQGSSWTIEFGSIDQARYWRNTLQDLLAALKVAEQVAGDDTDYKRSTEFDYDETNGDETPEKPISMADARTRSRTVG